MKQEIEGKIERIVDFIIKKPLSKITLDDYTILSSELRDIRFRESQAENGKRMADLVAASFSPASGIGSIK